MKVLVYTANLGRIDHDHPPVPQTGVDLTYHCFTEQEFPPRPLGLGRRMQARIPKIYGWDLLPGFDAYFWIDSTLSITRPDAVSWMLEQMGDAEIAVFAHPNRSTLQEEIDFVRTKLRRGSPYLNRRYLGEDLDGLEREVVRRGMQQAPLYASTLFCYRAPSVAMQRSFREWWELTSRYHSIDQVQYTLILEGHDVSVIRESIYDPSHLTWLGHG
jgi:hypothetical protein